MTTQHDCTLSPALLEQIASQGLDVLPDLMRTVINAAMEAERQQHLGVGRYARSPERRGYANGFKPKTMTTRVGAITFAVPQVRDGSFYPSALERGLRSERALTLALAEMYVQGVAQRAPDPPGRGHHRTAVRGRTVVEPGEPRHRAVGPSFGAMADPSAGRNAVCLSRRPLRKGAPGWAGARRGGADRDRRRPGGPAAGLGRVRGAQRAGGPLAAVPPRLGGPWSRRRPAGDQRCARWPPGGAAGGVRRRAERCQFHLQQNAGAYVPRQDQRAEVAADIRAIFTALNQHEAAALLAKTVQKYATTAPRLSTWLETAIPEGLTVFAFPAAHRRLLRTTNGVERLNKEIRRRTRVVSIFPNEASCLRLVSAILMEISEEWETGKTYLAFDAA